MYDDRYFYTNEKSNDKYDVYGRTDGSFMP